MSGLALRLAATRIVKLTVLSAKTSSTRYSKARWAA